MNGNDITVVRQMARAVSTLLTGKTPERRTLGEADDPEVRQLADLVDRLVRTHAEAGAFMAALAEGRLDVQPPVANTLASPFKHLHAHLKHLIWMTGQVSNGDLHQRVDFMGEISVSFNRMIEALREKERIEAALKKSEDQYRSLYDSMQEGVALHEMVWDGDGGAVDYRILEVNPAFEKITGIQGIAAVGTLGSVLYAAEPPPYLDVYARVARTGEPAALDVFFAPMNKHFSISVFSPAKGRFATVFSDITARKTAERDRMRRERLQGALETAGGVCHELNQPLMAASGYTELLLMDMAPDHPIREKLLKIRESVERMTKITRKLTQLTRYENRDYADGTKILDIHRSSTDG